MLFAISYQYIGFPITSILFADMVVVNYGCYFSNLITNPDKSEDYYGKIK